MNYKTQMDAAKKGILTKEENCCTKRIYGRNQTNGIGG